MRGVAEGDFLRFRTFEESLTPLAKTKLVIYFTYPKGLFKNLLKGNGKNFLATPCVVDSGKSIVDYKYNREFDAKI
jgi:hypothetical protein